MIKTITNQLSNEFKHLQRFYGLKEQGSRPGIAQKFLQDENDEDGDEHEL